MGLTWSNKGLTWKWSIYMVHDETLWLCFVSLVIHFSHFVSVEDLQLCETERIFNKASSKNDILYLSFPLLQFASIQTLERALCENKGGVKKQDKLWSEKVFAAFWLTSHSETNHNPNPAECFQTSWTLTWVFCYSGLDSLEWKSLKSFLKSKKKRKRKKAVRTHHCARLQGSWRTKLWPQTLQSNIYCHTCWTVTV